MDFPSSSWSSIDLHNGQNKKIRYKSVQCDSTIACPFLPPLRSSACARPVVRGYTIPQAEARSKDLPVLVQGGLVSELFCLKPPVRQNCLTALKKETCNL